MTRHSEGGRAARGSRAWALLLALALACAGCGRPPAEARRADRIVLVTIDTLRADHVGAYGAGVAHTPKLDSLAAAGVRFAVAVSPAPLTLPSHTTILTGLLPPHHGVRDNGSFRLDDGIPTLATQLGAAGFATAAFVGAVVLDRQYGLARGFDVYDDRMTGRLSAGELGFSERRADQVVDAALEWLAGAPDRFFLWVHLFDPHADYEPPAGFAAAFPGDPYAGEIAFADAELGRLLEALAARWSDGRTLVVATSDHGESLGEHGEITHSLGVYEATQHVPLLVRGPGCVPGHVVDEPVSLADLAPTLLARAGVVPPGGLDGLDLTPALEGEPGPRRVAYVETLATQLDFGWSPLLGVRSQRFKYIRAPRPELYDLASDPDELHDLAQERPEVAAELDAELHQFLVGARPVEPNLALDDATREQLEQLGYVAGEVEETAGAGGALGRVGGIDPKDGRPAARQLLRGMILLGRGQPDLALREVSSIQGGGAPVALFRSEAYRRAGDLAAAEAQVRAGLGERPDLPVLHLQLGRVLEARGRLDEAERAYRTAADLDPADARAVVGLGRIAEARGQRRRARERYQEAAERRSGSAEAIWRQAALAIEAGGDAESLLAQLPPAAAGDPDAVLRLAAAEEAAGRTDAARERLRAGIRLSPRDPRLRAALKALPQAGS